MVMLAAAWLLGQIPVAFDGPAMNDASVERPETLYAWNGEVALAYQVVGEGPIDLLYLQGWTSNIDLAWESPFLSRFLRGLSAHGRLILMDRRGWGCSDRFSTWRCAAVRVPD